MRRFGQVALCVLTLLAGCHDAGPGGEGGPSAGKPLKSPADRLSDREIELLIAVAGGHEQGQIPEFAMAAEDAPLDSEQPARRLEAAFQAQFEKLFDPQRQGEVWTRLPSWSSALRRHGADPAEFAALVRNVGCAVMRARLESRIDLQRLQENARAEVEETIAVMEAIEALPPAERTRQDGYVRTRAAVQLGRAVALRAFADMVASVPRENVALVKRHAGALRPLLPRGETEVLLEELRTLGMLHRSTIRGAAHEER